MPTLKYKDPTTGEWKTIRSGGNNKVPIEAEVANDGDYIYARDTLGNPIMIAKADMVSLIADAIKANEDEQRKVTFGSASIQELQETIGDNLYGATNASGMASVVAGQMASISTFEIRGTVNGSNPIGIVREVVNNIAIKDDSCFFVKHSFQGKRAVAGYVYGDKAYGCAIVFMYDYGFKVVLINNGNYNLL